MYVHDFSRSYVFNSSACDGTELNTCRTQVLSRCTLWDEATQTSQEFLLGKECIGEHMYLPQGIAQVPTSEVCIVFTAREFKLAKKFANHARDVVQVGDPEERMPSFSGKLFYWTGLRLAMKAVEGRPLTTIEEIARTTLAGERLVGRTTIESPDRRWRATIDYPIPYMNFHLPTQRFQVDVGPVLWPDWESVALPLVARMELAFVLFNSFDQAEFVRRMPTPVGGDQGPETLHYSRVMTMAAQNELFSIGE